MSPVPINKYIMKQYKVKEGFEVEENGSVFKAGDTLYLPPFRAAQIGLDKLEEVPETVKSASVSNDKEVNSLKQAYAELETEYNKEKEYSKGLGEISEAQKAEIEKLTSELAGVQGSLEAAQAEIEKLKKKK